MANSTSTMHTIQNHPITLDCFEIDDFHNIEYPVEVQRPEIKSNADLDFIQMCLIPYLEYLRTIYNNIQKEIPVKFDEMVMAKINKANRSAGSLTSGKVDTATPSISSMSSKDFEALKERVKRGEKITL